MSESAFAPAKVNLFLHVGPLGADGFHPLETLMVFADIGDRVAIGPEASPPLTLKGPFAFALEGDDNLVLAAARSLARIAGRGGGPPALVLEKRLPVAAGLGGGSADAAAALRLLNRIWATDLDEPALEALAADLGSDVPACVASRPVIASGRGERLRPASRLPDLSCVLVNPGVACPTGAVYRAFDRSHSGGRADPVLDPGPLADPRAVAGWLSGLRNDLESAAIEVAPVIGEVLCDLRRSPDALLARLSGSGATCFAICADPEAAGRLAAKVGNSHPDWWVKVCRLGAPLSHPA